MYYIYISFFYNEYFCLHSLFFFRKYLPLLKKFPAEYIYEPWKAPRSVQQAAGCIVGKDYPQPIAKHEVISKKNIQRMKLAYAKRSGDSAESANKSPVKRQGNAGLFLAGVCHVYRTSCSLILIPSGLLL